MSEFKVPSWPTPPSGWHKITDEHYFGLPAYGSHDIKRALKSPAHVHGEASYSSAALRLGGAFHLYTLVNPELVQPEPLVNKRTTEGKAEIARFQAGLPPGAMAIDAEEHQTVRSMFEAIHGHKYARALLEAKDGVNEIAGVVTEGAVNKRVKPDRRIPSKGMIVDLKTCDDCSGDVFGRDATKYRYWLQAAFYLDTANEIEALLGSGIRYELFLFLVVEKKPPFGVRVFEVSREGIDLGREQWTKGWKLIEQSAKTGVWPKYHQEIEVLVPPAYAFYE